MSGRGCLFSIAYWIGAAYIFSMIMMGDCDPAEAARCEAGRTYWLIGLFIVALGVWLLVMWKLSNMSANE